MKINRELEQLICNLATRKACTHCGKQYLVRWVGYDRDHDEWLSGKLLEDTEALDVWEAENGIDV
jgi:hypothetical protein